MAKIKPTIKTKNLDVRQVTDVVNQGLPLIWGSTENDALFMILGSLIIWFCESMAVTASFFGGKEKIRGNIRGGRVKRLMGSMESLLLLPFIYILLLSMKFDLI